MNDERSRAHSPRWTFAFLALFFILIYAPLLLLLCDSLLQRNAMGLSEAGAGWTFAWFNQVLSDPQLLEPAMRSLTLAILNGFFSSIIGVTAALALRRRNGALEKVLTFFVASSLALPELVFALSLLSWFFILQWHLSLFTVVVSHITFSLAFVVFIVASRLTQLDPSLEEAGQDLGASYFQILFKVTLPQLLPSVWLSFAICFLLSFDDFLISFFVSGVGYDTLPIRLYQSIRQGTSPKLSALAILLILIPILLAGVAQLFRLRSPSFTATAPAAPTESAART